MVTKVIINKDVNMGPQSDFSTIWEANMDDEPMDVALEPHIIDDELDDLLIIGDDVEDDASLGLVDDEMDDDGVFSRDTIFHPDPPATPPPEDPEHEDSYRFVREVTPEKAKDIVTMDVDDIRLPGLDELREEYSLSCKRMGEKIWHAEMTRRWRARFCGIEKNDKTDETPVHANEFLSGARSTLTNDLEISRRKLWAMIHSPPPSQF